jgi:hypothetical protein
LQSKIPFPAEIPFSKIQKKKLAEKKYFANERGPFVNPQRKLIKLPDR